VPPGEPLFDHIVIVRFVAQFALRFQVSHRLTHRETRTMTEARPDERAAPHMPHRLFLRACTLPRRCLSPHLPHRSTLCLKPPPERPFEPLPAHSPSFSQMTARVGVHVWLHDTAPSGLIWVQPNASAHSLTPSEHATRSTLGAMPDLRTASNLALLANVGGQVRHACCAPRRRSPSPLSCCCPSSPFPPPPFAPAMSMARCTPPALVGGLTRRVPLSCTCEPPAPWRCPAVTPHLSPSHLPDLNVP
jgi:hypothetical protein